jgi:hypothetical protein
MAILTRSALLTELLPGLNKVFNDTYNGEALKLYKYVVHIERQKVEITSIDGGNGVVISQAITTPYKNLEEVPEELRNKIKRLMWCAESDIHDGLGVKVNDATYWVS